jgi:uncharacterized membrane protein YphA (DoxX/SURF4 family)
MVKIPGGRWFIVALRIGVGAAFVYAGAIKFGDPLQFADNIATFRVLPGFLINPLALSLPIFEVLSGGLLMAVGFDARRRWQSSSSARYSSPRLHRHWHVD